MTRIKDMSIKRHLELLEYMPENYAYIIVDTYDEDLGICEIELNQYCSIKVYGDGDLWLDMAGRKEKIENKYYSEVVIR
jgi:hypothetical protein